MSYNWGKARVNKSFKVVRYSLGQDDNSAERVLNDFHIEIFRPTLSFSREHGTYLNITRYR